MPGIRRPEETRCLRPGSEEGGGRTEFLLCPDHQDAVRGQRLQQPPSGLQAPLAAEVGEGKIAAADQVELSRRGFGHKIVPPQSHRFESLGDRRPESVAATKETVADPGRDLPQLRALIKRNSSKVITGSAHRSKASDHDCHGFGGKAGEIKGGPKGPPFEPRRYFG